MKKYFNSFLLFSFLILFASCSSSKSNKISLSYMDENFVPTKAEMVLVEGKYVDGKMLSDFYLSNVETTQEEYYNLMGKNDSEFKAPYSPVERVSWYEAVEFCNAKSEKEGLEKCYAKTDLGYSCDFTKNGYRLPTLEEWKFASEGGRMSKGFVYSGSNNIDEVAWYEDNSEERTHAVGKKKANELGLYDMSGNVWEWVWDAKDNARYLTGGGWNYSASICTPDSKYHRRPNYKGHGIGFRVARSKV